MTDDDHLSTPVDSAARAADILTSDHRLGPMHSPCGLCGDVDQMHRTWDRCAERWLAGEPTTRIAQDYDVETDAVVAVLVAQAAWLLAERTWQCDQSRQLCAALLDIYAPGLVIDWDAQTLDLTAKTRRPDGETP